CHAWSSRRRGSDRDSSRRSPRATSLCRSPWRRSGADRKECARRTIEGCRRLQRSLRSPCARSCFRTRSSPSWRSSRPLPVVSLEGASIREDQESLGGGGDSWPEEFGPASAVTPYVSPHRGGSDDTGAAMKSRSGTLMELPACVFVGPAEAPSRARLVVIAA